MSICNMSLYKPPTLYLYYKKQNPTSPATLFMLVSSAQPQVKALGYDILFINAGPNLQ